MSEEHNSPRKAFDANDLERLQRCEDEQGKFRSRLKARGNFTREEETALEIDSYDAFLAFWKKTLDTRATFDADRTRGTKKAAKRATDFMASADDMIQGFKPIVEVIRDFGAPYGALAIGTVCFLFTVAKNRNRMEEAINKTLLEIRDRLPGVKMYGYIYSASNELDHVIQSKIVDAYESFIHFCMAATEFHTQRACRRWLMAIGGSEHLDAKISDVQNAVVAIRTAGEELMTRTVHEIKMQNEGLEQKVQRLEQRLQELQDSQDNENLDRIRRQLELEPFLLDDQKEKLTEYRRDIVAEFGESDFIEKPYAERLQALEADAAFQDWMCHPGSRMLVISGRNEVYDATNCWVSPVALDLIAKLAANDVSTVPSDEFRVQYVPRDDVCVFYAPPPRDGRYTFQGVMSTLVHQLLRESQHCLRKEEQAATLRTHLEHYLDIKKRTGTVSAVQEPLERLMLTILNFFAGLKRNVWIILDRVDRGEDGVSEFGKLQRNMHRSALLHVMARLMHASDSTVKILAVVNTVDWDLEAFEKDFGYAHQKNESVVIRKVSEDEMA